MCIYRIHNATYFLCSNLDLNTKKRTIITCSLKMFIGGKILFRLSLKQKHRHLSIFHLQLFQVVCDIFISIKQWNELCTNHASFSILSTKQCINYLFTHKQHFFSTIVTAAFGPLNMDTVAITIEKNTLHTIMR